ncbi:Sec63 domain [Macleaya cordata]|uniref:Sec63 domain n=1 Tax=Macleaya cordata TaxID=56857 RepID=A0A200QRM6_MACCD|nr:Sec63 domain [Macleaya cordata]
MLPSMTADLVSLLGKRGVSNVQHLLNLPKTTLQSLIQNFAASLLYQDLQHFPCVHLRLKLQHRDRQGSRSRILNIRLENTNYKHKTSRAFVPRFPKVKDEAWWLVRGNVSTSELYALKRVSFSDRLVTNMDIPSSLTSLQHYSVGYFQHFIKSFP